MKPTRSKNAAQSRANDKSNAKAKTRVKAKPMTSAQTKAKQEPHTKSLTADTLSIRNIHSLTKELITTLYTIEKSLVLVTQLLTLLDNYNINLKSLNSKEIAGILKKLNVPQLEKTLEIFQKPEVLGLLKALSNSVESGSKPNTFSN